MVGSSVIRLLKDKGFQNIITMNKKKLNLLNQKETFNFLKETKPDSIVIAAAKVGGINANNLYRAEFIYQNLQIQNNLIHGSYISGIKNLIFLGSSCIYPRDSIQPIKEKYLLTSPLEYTNEPYAIAKIAGVKMIENYNKQYKTNYLCLMPCNLYGPNDNYDLKTSHFLPAIIKRIHDAKTKNKEKVIFWGNGTPLRELMHVDDLANAVYFFLGKKTSEYLINVGSNTEYSIRDYIKLVCKIIGYTGKISFDKKMPNGTPRKLLDCSIANKLGWRHKIKIEEGIKSTYSDYLKNEIL